MPVIESVSKVAGGFLLAAYVSGYLIVSIHYSSYGFTELNPLKPNPQRRRSVDWTTQLFVPITALFFFSRWVYPKIKASWGGGEPIPAVLYLTKDSALKPGEPYPVLLLDESDTGCYFVEQLQSKAVFIPRAQVSMIFFSDKPQPTPSTEKPNSVTPQPTSSSPTLEKPKPQP